MAWLPRLFVSKVYPLTPLLPLDTFRHVLGWSPFHFWGLSDPEFTPLRAQCVDLLKEYAWQNTDYTGRAEIAAAIESAERLLRDYLGYAIAPEYREVTVPWPRYYDPSRSRWRGVDATGRWVAPAMPFGCGQIQALGVEVLTLQGTVAAGVGLVFSDEDNDGLDDTFTATATVPTGTDPETVGVYFVAADRLDGEAAGQQWRVRPVSVSITGTTATIIGRIWLLVRPILYEGVSVQPLDPTDTGVTGPYAQSLEVYTRATNIDGNTVATSQAKLIWETRPCHGWWCCCGCQDTTYEPAGSPHDPAAIGVAIARAGIRDARLGLVGIGSAVLNVTTGIWSSDCWGVCAEPDRVTVRLLAGEPLESGNVARKWQTIVARLAMAEMARPLVACEAANRELFRWQLDVALVDGHNEEKYQASDADLACPWGTRRGHIWAWRQVQQLKVTLATIDS